MIPGHPIYNSQLEVYKEIDEDNINEDEEEIDEDDFEFECYMCVIL
jgi:hypothetical protein